LETDTISGAVKLSRELREASRRVGQRRLESLIKIRPTPMLEKLQSEIQAGKASGHHSTVFGCACVELQVADALIAYFYQSVSGFCFASLKLLRIGPDGVQRVLTECLAKTDEIVDAAGKVSTEEIGWFDPVLDLASMRHEIANERLFIS
jgi:urease accessory protein